MVLHKIKIRPKHSSSEAAVARSTKRYSGGPEVGNMPIARDPDARLGDCSLIALVSPAQLIIGLNGPVVSDALRGLPGSLTPTPPP